MSEKRINARHTPTALAYVSAGSSNGGILLNVSESGCALQLISPPPASSQIGLELDLGNALPRVPATGKVIWTDKSGCTGIRFTSLSDDGREIIRRFIASGPAEFGDDEFGPNLPLNISPVNGHASGPTGQAGTAQEPGFFDALGPKPLEERLKGLSTGAAFLAIAEECQVVAAATAVALALLQGKDMVCCASAGAGAPPSGSKIDLKSERSFTAQCVAAGTILRCVDSQIDPRVNSAVCQRLGIRSVAAVPLIYQRTVVGVLVAFSSERNAFSDAHIAALDQLGALSVDFAVSRNELALPPPAPAPRERWAAEPRQEIRRSSDFSPAPPSSEIASVVARHTSPEPAFAAAPAALLDPQPAERAHTIGPGTVPASALVLEPLPPLTTAPPAAMAGPAATPAVAPAAAPSQAAPVEPIRMPAAAQPGNASPGNGKPASASPVNGSKEQPAPAPPAAVPEPARPQAAPPAAATAAAKIPALAPEQAAPRQDQKDDLLATAKATGEKPPAAARTQAAPPSNGTPARVAQQPAAPRPVPAQAKAQPRPAPVQKPAPQPAKTEPAAGAKGAQPESPMFSSGSDGVRKEPFIAAIIVALATLGIVATWQYRLHYGGNGDAAPQVTAPAQPPAATQQPETAPSNQAQSNQAQNDANTGASPDSTPDASTGGGAPVGTADSSSRPVSSTANKAAGSATKPPPAVISLPPGSAQKHTGAGPEITAPSITPSNQLSAVASESAASLPSLSAGSGPVKVSSVAINDRLLHKVDPKYPESARKAGITGAVRLRLEIGADGKVKSATILDGPQELASAAKAAVTQWRYRPYVVDKKTVPVETEVIVRFTAK
ncbi:MAG: TonB family protein [Acidobacteria bacterium]|nr:TonB family protein [Acidobacteriota bacterium]